LLSSMQTLGYELSTLGTSDGIKALEPQVDAF
jgi:hypothetical protein